MPIRGVASTDTITGTFSLSGLKIAGRVTIVSINDATWTALPPGGALTLRNAICIINTSTVEIKVNYDFPVLLPAGYVGVPLEPNGNQRFYDITPAIPIYAKSFLGTVDITVEELS